MKLTDILKQMLIEELEAMNCESCGQEENTQLLYEKLCPKGKAYADRRKDAGEKHSAYLMGRAVQVCSGGIGKKKKKVKKEEVEESLHSWFKEEDWVRIDTEGNIAGPCGSMKKGKPTTRCLPRAKAESLSKEERAATSKKKVAASKKGKQFVSNTNKAKVSFKSRTKDKKTESLDEMNLKQGLAAIGISLITLLGTPDTSKASTPTSTSQVASKSIIEKVVKRVEKEGYSIDFLEKVKYKNFENAGENDIKLELGTAKTISAARLTMMEFIRVNSIDRNKTLFMFNSKEEKFVIIYTKK
jgi:hypothetical protein